MFFNNLDRRLASRTAITQKLKMLVLVSKRRTLLT